VIIIIFEWYVICMEEEKVLLGIKKAEEKAGEIVAKAEKERDGMLKKAHLEAAEIERQEVENKRKELEREYRRFKAKIQAKKGEIDAVAKREIRKIRKRESNIGRAVEYVSKEFERLLKEGL